MSKGAKKKKKKDLDFQKVKLKVGRRLKRDDNETKAEFHTRKIILKEVKSYSDDPLYALSHHSENISHKGKLSLLNHINSALTAPIVRELNKPSLDSLTKFILDHSDQVRATTFRCLKTCFNHLRQQRLSTKDFLSSLKPYLDCAYTHVSVGISADCHKFLEYLVNANDPTTFEPLMEIILRRYEAGNLDDREAALVSQLKNYYLKFKHKQTLDQMVKGDKLEPLVWTLADYFIDLDSSLHNDNRCVPEMQSSAVNKFLLL